jgi:hypothetical protein
VSGDFAVATSAFTVSAGSGNTGIAGSLEVAGASTLTGTTSMESDLTIGSSTFTVAAGSGNTVVQGNLMCSLPPR